MRNEIEYLTIPLKDFMELESKKDGKINMEDLRKLNKDIRFSSRKSKFNLIDKDLDIYVDGVKTNLYKYLWDKNASHEELDKYINLRARMSDFTRATTKCKCGKITCDAGYKSYSDEKLKESCLDGFLHRVEPYFNYDEYKKRGKDSNTFIYNDIDNMVHKTPPMNIVNKEWTLDDIKNIPKRPPVPKLPPMNMVNREWDLQDYKKMNQNSNDEWFTESYKKTLDVNRIKDYSDRIAKPYSNIESLDLSEDLLLSMVKEKGLSNVNPFFFNKIFSERFYLNLLEFCTDIKKINFNRVQTFHLIQRCLEIFPPNMVWQNYSIESKKEYEQNTKDSKWVNKI